MKILFDTRDPVSGPLRGTAGQESFFIFYSPSAAQEAPSGAAATIITDQLSNNDSGDYAKKIRFYRGLGSDPFCDLCDFQMWIIFFYPGIGGFLG
jgi:hypothetical protein